MDTSHNAFGGSRKNAVVNVMEKWFDRDERMHLLYLDAGYGAFTRIPDHRKTNTGIREQATIGVASGMAIAGFRPVVFGLYTFLTLRCLEQIRLDIVHMEQPVKLIGCGANDYYHRLGVSHCMGMKDEYIMRCIGMPVWDLLDCETQDEAEEVAHTFFGLDMAGYLRC